MNYGSAGNGGSSHPVPEIFKQATGTFIVHIPYLSIAPALTDRRAGQERKSPLRQTLACLSVSGASRD